MKPFFTFFSLSILFTFSANFAGAQTITLSPPTSSSTNVDSLTTSFSIIGDASAQQIIVVWTQTSGGPDVGKIWTFTMKANTLAQSFTLRPLNLTTSANAFTAAPTTPMSEGFYSVYAQYQRPAAAGGTFLKTTTRTNVYLDLYTETPTVVTPVSNSYVNNNFQFISNLPENYLAGSASLSFMQGSTTITKLALPNTLLKDTFNININNILAGNSAHISSATSNSIPTGVYDLVLSYQDRYSHAAATATATNVTIDTSIAAPVITAPASGATLKTNFSAGFILPERAVANSVKLVFEKGTESDTLVVSDTSAGSHTLTIYPALLAASTDVVSSTTAALTDGQYTFKLFFTNMVGLMDSTQSSFALQTDTITLLPVLTAPATNAAEITTSNISFTLPENAKANSVQIEYLGCSDNAVTLDATSKGAHTYALNGSDIAASTGVTSATSPTLSSGTYAVILSYQDSSGNPRSYALNRNYQFTNNVLGLNFEMLKGYLQLAKTHLLWETVTEDNLAYFDVQYSKDAKAFSSIGKVKAVGTSYIKQDYTFIDNDPVMPKNYYRLRMVDQNGTFHYSPVIVVYENNVQEEFKVFPNPAADKLNVSIVTSNTNNNHTLKVWDMEGKLVKTMNVQADSGSNLFSFSIDGLSAGNYALQDGDNVTLFSKN